MDADAEPYVGHPQVEAGWFDTRAVRATATISAPNCEPSATAVADATVSAGVANSAAIGTGSIALIGADDIDAINTATAADAISSTADATAAADVTTADTMTTDADATTDANANSGLSAAVNSADVESISPWELELLRPSSSPSQNASTHRAPT